jgi:hypothetical protein
LETRDVASLECVHVRPDLSRALCTLLFACLLACASEDESGAPLEQDAEAVLTPSVVEPADEPNDAAAAPFDRDAARADPALDATSALDAAPEASGQPAVLDAAHGASEGGATLDAGSVGDAGLAAADASAADASQPAPRDAGTDAARDASLEAATPLDGGNQEAGDTSDAGAVDAAVPADAATSDATSPAERATFTRIYALLRQRCRSCHQPGATYSLDFSSKQIAYDELVGGPNMGAAEFIVCSGFGYRRVVPGDPEASLLVQKLEATQPCGDRMPPGALSDLGLSGEVRRWISAGALND